MDEFNRCAVNQRFLQTDKSQVINNQVEPGHFIHLRPCIPNYSELFDTNSERSELHIVRRPCIYKFRS